MVQVSHEWKGVFGERVGQPYINIFVSSFSFFHRIDAEPLGMDWDRVIKNILFFFRVGPMRGRMDAYFTFLIGSVCACNASLSHNAGGRENTINLLLACRMPKLMLH